MRKCSLVISEPERYVEEESKKQLADPIVYNPGSLPLVGSLVYFRKRGHLESSGLNSDQTRSKLLDRKSSSYPNLSQCLEQGTKYNNDDLDSLQPTSPSSSISSIDSQKTLHDHVLDDNDKSDPSFDELDSHINHQRRNSSGWNDTGDCSRSLKKDRKNNIRHRRRLTCAVVFTKPRLVQL
ncbi:hypothetical protein KL918_001403 [Ogataea parapolymorpha]|uniref:Uncharacterized protein n=1 Tax=Ogataea parapolymorpha (strain ATCC 26012 / BCRC 20466 / JCM 22074 / NRRL Y-7560 / DL-1) TaxID=871575 RepID=W1QDX2_OGAPD|nr:hypothetical protein HPODL_03540 [Ogataea parapolymorpha DL-1]ESW99663.1 hypothetical protein HPODL_03540 [Ogataea parapolymorpha DL-1]KAG7868760.1 hypothetical protein KL918_001403 [Ogataea parapolymorpha]KAG7874459.1 hypothetical protein KL916_001225 [Ogataea parapolymorpha]